MYIKKKKTLDSDAVVAEVRRVYFEHYKIGQMTIKMFSLDMQTKSGDLVKRHFYNYIGY